MAAGMNVLAYAERSDPAALRQAGGQVFTSMHKPPGALEISPLLSSSGRPATDSAGYAHPPRDCQPLAGKVHQPHDRGQDTQTPEGVSGGQRRDRRALGRPVSGSDIAKQEQGPVGTRALLLSRSYCRLLAQLTTFMEVPARFYGHENSVFPTVS